MKKTLFSLSFILSLSACMEIDVNPKAFTGARCSNRLSDGGPAEKSPYQTLIWADEFNGPEPGDDPSCFTRAPQCANRLDWPGTSAESNCPKDMDANNFRNLNKCTWKLWNSFSMFDANPKDKLAYHPNQVRVRGGTLALTINYRPQKPGAKCGMVPGSDPNSNDHFGKECEWISGGIDSSHFDGNSPGRNIKNGRIEMRAKLPPGIGLYPALWTWADNAGKGTPHSNPKQRPAFSGEYDIIEATSNSSGIIHGFQTYHDWGYAPKSHQQAGSGKIFLDPNTWYRFGVERYQNKMRFYVDDCYTYEVEADDKGIRLNSLAHYILMNLSLEKGVAFQAKEVDGKILEVDYVRLYQ